MKRLKIALALAAVSLAIYIGFYFKHFYRFPFIVSRWYAKEFCSCIYVLERDEQFCHERVRQWIPIQDVQIDHLNKKIAAKGFWIWSKAQFEGPRYGCRLVETRAVP